MYFISGLGADWRVFKKLELPGDWNIHHVEWIENKPGELLKDYCHRLAEQIDTRQPFVLVGLSLGGIVSIELSKFLKPEKIILLSSVSSRSDLPYTLRLFKYLPVYKLIPDSMLISPNRLTYWLMGLSTPEELELMKEVLNESSPTFATWSIGCISSWDNQLKPANTIHIHGSSDRIFPKHYNHADIVVPGGGHLMTYSKADIISKLLLENITHAE